MKVNRKRTLACGISCANTTFMGGVENKVGSTGKKPFLFNLPMTLGMRESFDLQSAHETLLLTPSLPYISLSLPPESINNWPMCIPLPHTYRASMLYHYS